MAELCLLHEESGLIAVSKPAGIPSTGRELSDPLCVQSMLEIQLGREVWAVHQLDKGTTGVNLFVDSPSLVAEWQSRLKGGGKTYTAVCHGAPDWRTRVVDGPIGWAAGQRRRWVIQGGKSASTGVTVLDRATHYCVLRARPHTGRTHQVRIHLAYVGHPLVGESRYRRKSCRRLNRPALHLGELRLPGLPRLSVPMPADMLQVASELRLELPGGAHKRVEAYSRAQ